MSRPVLLHSALTALLLAAIPASACIKPENSDAVRAELIQAVNAQRRTAGLSPLRASGLLTSAAQSHACDNANHNLKSHVGSDGAKLGPRIKRTGYPLSMGNENVGWGFRSPASAVQWWMNSPGHRKNILTPGIREIGVGMAYGPDNRPYWVMISASSR